MELERSEIVSIKKNEFCSLKKHAFEQLLGETDVDGITAFIKSKAAGTGVRVKVINSKIFILEFPRPMRFKYHGLQIGNITLQRIKIKDIYNIIDFV